MYFFAEHRHTGATCFSKDESKTVLFDNLITEANEHGVKIHRLSSNP